MMRAAIFLSMLLCAATVQAQDLEHVPFCDLIKERAVGLLEYRFSDSFDLVDAKAHTPNEPLFESMLRHAWSTKPGKPNERESQVREFGEFWYGECVLRGF